MEEVKVFYGEAFWNPEDLVCNCLSGDNHLISPLDLTVDDEGRFEYGNTSIDDIGNYKVYLPLVAGIKRGYASNQRIGDRINILEIRLKTMITNYDASENRGSKMLQQTLMCVTGWNKRSQLNLSDIYDPRAPAQLGSIVNTIPREVTKDTYKIINTHRNNSGYWHSRSAEFYTERWALNKEVIYSSGPSLGVETEVMKNMYLVTFQSVPGDILPVRVDMSFSVYYTDI